MEIYKNNFIELKNMKENIKDNNIDEITIIYQNRGNILIDPFDNWYIKEKLGEEISNNKLFGEKFIIIIKNIVK